ncbi:MAG: GAF domain-containing sensor histidine kinase [Chloroflexi bacterium]|nr:GAF domain-containing sensor histidine kinase [Chloroflexota bacterium]
MQFLNTRLPNLISLLRWIIPTLIFLIGFTYVLFDQVWYQGQSPSSLHVLRTFLILNVAGPFLAWLTLTLALRAANAEAQAQHEIALQNRELAALATISRVANQSLDLDQITNTALEKMVTLLGLPMIEIRLVEKDHLVLKAHYGLSPEFVGCSNPIALGECLCGQCALDGTMRVRDILTNGLQPTNEFCRQERVRSTITIPMQAQGHVIGVVHAGSPLPNAFGTREQRVLGEICERLVTAIENAQLYAETRRRSLHLETASLVGQRIFSLVDPPGLLDEVTKLIQDKFGYTHIHILLVNERNHTLVLQSASGPCAETMLKKGLRLKIGEEGITGWVAQTGEPLLCNNVSEEPHYYAEEPETNSELAVALRIGERILGVLDVQSAQRDAFDADDVTVLQILGSQIGAALENARLFQETRQRYEAMFALHETSLDMIAQLNMPQLLEALLRRGTQLLGARSGILFLNNPSNQTIDVVASYNAWKNWRGVTLKTDEGVPGYVIRTGKPIIVNDYASWPNKPRAFAGSPDGCVVSAPLTWRQQTIGAIDIFNAEPNPKPFNENDLWLLGLFADLATIAIKNAELHSQVKEFSRDLENKVEQRTHELEIAKEAISHQAEQLRHLLNRTISIQEEERERIARDMHDDVVQLITAVRYELKTAKFAIESGVANSALEEFETMRQSLDEMEMEIRHAIYDLKPPALDAIGLVPALQNYVERYEGFGPTLCQMQVRGMPFRLAPSTETSIFRIVEEALHNVRKHAQAKTASVILDFQPTMLEVLIEDDGNGFDYTQWLFKRMVTHLGLLGMQERARNIGGTLQVSSNLGHGTRLTFRLPVELDGGPVSKGW